MAARVLDIENHTREASTSRRPVSFAPPPPSFSGLADGLTSRFHFWRGASGALHAFYAYGLIECPPLEAVAYLLVRRDGDGRRTVIASGTAEQAHAPLNLATLRYHGASLGANEVHIATSALDAAGRAAIAAEFARPKARRPASGAAHTDAYCSL